MNNIGFAIVNPNHKYLQNGKQKLRVGLISVCTRKNKSETLLEHKWVNKAGQTYSC